MPNFAEIVLASNTSQMDKAEGALEGVTRAGAKTEAQVGRTANATTKLAASQARAAKTSHTLAAANRSASFQTANLTAQFNDIGIMLAAGQNPMQLALQQGTQINQVMTQMGGGVKSLKALGPAIMSMISPMSILTIGVIAGGAALTQWAMSAFGASEEARALEDRLEAIGEKSQAMQRELDALSLGVSQEEVDLLNAVAAAREKINKINAVQGPGREAALAGIAAAREDLSIAEQSLQVYQQRAAALEKATQAHDLIAQKERETAENAIRSAQAAEDLLADLSAQVDMQAAIAVHGADSAQVTELRVRAERAAFEQTLAGMQVSEALKNELRLAWEMASNLSQTNIAAGIAAGANEAARLVQNLSLAAQLAQRPGLTSVLSDEDAAMGVPVAQNSASRLSNLRALNNLYKETAVSISGGGGGGVSGAQQELNKALEEGKRITESLRTPLENYQAKLTEIDALLSAGHITQETYNRGLSEMQDELLDSSAGFEALGDVVDGVFDGSLRTLEDFVRHGGRLLSQFFADATKQALSSYFLPNIGGSPAAGGMGASLLGSFGGSGLMGGLGNALSGGLGGVFNIGTNAAAAGGGALATIGAAMPVVAGLGLAVAAFTTKTKELDAGIRITASGATLAADEFRKLEKSRFFGLSKSTSTTSSASGMTGALQDAYSQIFDGVTGIASTLGIGAKAFDDFSKSISVSTKDMTAEQAQAAVMAEMARTQDALAKRALVALKGSAKLVKGGESASDALSRVSEALLVTTDVFDRLGGSAFDFTAKGAAAAAKLVEMAGGADALAQNAANFVDGFYTTEEKLKLAKGDFRKSVGELGINSVPQTKEEFRQLVDRLLEQGKNRKAAGLMALSDEFLQIRGFKQELKALAKEAEESARQVEDLRREEELARRQRRQDRIDAVDENQFGTFAQFQAAQVIAAQDFSEKGSGSPAVIALLNKMVDHLAKSERNTGDLVAYQFKVT